MSNGNGIEAGVGNKYVRITGREIIVIVMLAVALGWIVWNIKVQHDTLARAIETRCGPMLVF